MGYSDVRVENDPLEGDLLIVEGEPRKGSVYIARITGTDPKYKYAREFLGTSEWTGKHIKAVKVKVSELKDGDLLDIGCGGSWKNRYRFYGVWDAEKMEVREIDEKELRERLAVKLKAESLITP